jgi:hypothetical protein
MAERAPRPGEKPAEHVAQDTPALDPALIDILGAGSLLGKPARGRNPRDYRSYQRPEPPRDHVADNSRPRDCPAD